jgi:hypothetical protein
MNVFDFGTGRNVVRGVDTEFNMPCGIALAPDGSAYMWLMEVPYMDRETV